MAQNIKLLVGADPELFLYDKTAKQIVAAKIPGTKLEPFKVEMGAIQVDGTAAEFNIEPAYNAEGFVTNIKHVMNQMKKYTKDQDFVLDPTVEFEASYFASLPETVRELGCNPDFNAWTGVVNPSPDGASTTMRTAAGHIHIGWTKNINPLDPMHFEDCRTVVKQMDYYLGLWSLKWDPDPKRRQLYGKAGAFRPKPYGVEYRTLSNVWLRSQKVQTWIFHAVFNGVHSLLNGKKNLEDQYGDFARRMIDENVTTWDSTKEGQQIISYIGMQTPAWQECLANVGYLTEEQKLERAAKRKEAKIKADPAFYGTGTANSIQGMTISIT